MKITIHTNGSFSWFNKRTKRNENIQSDLAKAIIALEKNLALALAPDPDPGPWI